jgi:RNA polymerase-binding transcription factor DksA
MQTKQEEALSRQQAFDALTIEQKLKKLEDAGHGHCKEAQKYIEQLGEVPEKVTKATNKSRKMRKRDRKVK